MSNYEVQAIVLDIDRNGFHRLKVSLEEMGMYMFGFRAKHTDKRGWWIQPPSTKTTSGWKMNPEFDKSKPLWIEIEKACILAIEDYGRADDDRFMSTEEYSTALGVVIDNMTPMKQVESIPWMDEELS